MLGPTSAGGTAFNTRYLQSFSNAAVQDQWKNATIINLQQYLNEHSTSKDLENILVLISSEQLRFLQLIQQRGLPIEIGVQTETTELRRFWSHKTIQQASSFSLTKDDLAIGKRIEGEDSSSNEEDYNIQVRSSSRSVVRSGSKKLRRKRSNEAKMVRSLDSEVDVKEDLKDVNRASKRSLIMAESKRSLLSEKTLLETKEVSEDEDKDDSEKEADKDVAKQELENSLNLGNGGALSPTSDSDGSGISGSSEGSSGSPKTREVHFTKTVTTGYDKDGKKFVNEYIVIKKIGKGMHGKVKLCRRSDNNELVAMKIINKSCFKDARKKDRLGRPMKSGDDSNLMSLMKEVAILKKVSHPNVVELYEVIDDPKTDKLFLVFEYIERGCLMKLLSFEKTDREPFSENACRKYFRDLICGLEYLHENKIVHRDIKPENILITNEDRLKITDFGVSTVLEGDNAMFNTAPGTPAFLSPEACHVGSYNGYASDIWASGVTLFVLAFGKLPFVGFNIVGMYNSIMNDEPDIPDIASSNLKDLLVRLFCKDWQKRITIKEIKEHPWVTMDGTWPLETQVDRIVQSTEQEIATAITLGRELKVMDRMVLLSKLKNRFSKKASKARDKIRQKRNQSLNHLSD
ncbi:hypothetical protein C9374_010196 [Naegleria lovaniensis]|uniref:Protein kinase domain-containing protein n=1 Tax=Naegleria lovaniensis TaxID=51637 RepID=A0AA88GGJ1_NAELO|nr:uncharacterized protein C9374_010196 [Naegleria lovaniensis]KAG2375192.1 hypothetical protein C9374_010196 [Naegleria lovaniensis]